MYQFISGLLMMGYVVIGAFFFKYWKTTHDRLFGWFSTAFFVLASQRLILVYVHPTSIVGTEARDASFYVIRLLAFLLIVAAIVEKNRAETLSFSMRFVLSIA